ncbi:MAG: ABC transporter permease, partial [Bryobacteraceae bacterium]
MKWFHNLMYRRLRREAAEEVASHLEERIDDLVECGLSEAEARQQAKREFGNVVRIVEQSRDEWTFTWLDQAVRDLRYGLRMLRKNPALAAVATLSLALGIGANTAIFSFIDAILLRSLPVRQPHALVIVRALTRQGTRDSFSHADYQWLNEHNHVFSGLAAFAAWNLTLDLGDRKEKLPGELVSGNYFSVLGVEPTLGRMIAPPDDASPGNRPVAVISYAFWQRAYGRNHNVVGQRLKFDHVALEIIGVAPRNFSGEYEGYSPDVWAPLAMQPQLNGGKSFLNTRNISWLNSMGRLAPGVTLREARAGAPVLLNGLRNALHIDAQNDYLGSIGIEPGSGGISGLRDQYSQPLRILMALVALVLLIACANVANLLLVRSAARSREFAVRLAIGAGRSRLIRQLLTEALLLAAISCALGLGLAYLMIHGLLAISQIDSPDVHLNLKVLAFAALISSAAALAFGLAPA